MYRSVAALLVLVSAALVHAAPPPSPDGVWIPLDEVPADVAAAEPWIRPQKFAPVLLVPDALKRVLANAPMEFTPEAAQPLLMNIPRPDGTMALFEVVESPIMAPELAAEFPEIKTYQGQGLDDPHATIRFDWTYQGFHAQVLTPEGSWYIDPYSRGDRTFYTSYYRRDYGPAPTEWKCLTTEELPHAEHGGGYSPRNATPLETYRLACAATAEYTAFHGGTVALGQSAIVTAINRVTGVYETQLAIRLTLVANNSSLVYTNSGTDPYTNNNGGTMLGQNQSNIDAVIGSANYDIGHVFSTGGGGIAGLGVVCVGGNKARGVTGLPSPTGDVFYIDFVAHEMGHQFGANHTFNSPNGNCAGGNRSASNAYEPGSGSTIMAYAGICSPDNLQAASDAYFHFASLAAITAFRNSTGNCGANTNTGNTAPTVSGGSAVAIPANTPFTLTAVGNDANGDPLTYCWEERDLGAALSLAAADNGASPLIRSWPATTAPTRTVPRLSNLLANTFAIGEELPTTTRNLNFRVVARDNRAAAGGYGVADKNISVTNTGSAFAVTAPNTNVSWSGNQTVTWNVAGTTAAPINCANVKISISTDGGLTFPTVLLASTPNDGSEVVTLPNVTTSSARIKVEAVGNIFFDISNVNFSLTGVPPPGTPTDVAATPSVVCPGQSTTLSATVPAGQTVDWYSSGCGVSLVGSGTSLVVTPAANTTYRARARVIASGDTSVSCGVVFVSVSNPVAITQQPAPVAVAAGGSASFQVVATGAAPITYTWRLNGNALSNGGVVSGANTATLTINPVSVADAGAYDVIVGNACGPVVSASAELSILPSGCGTADFDGDGDAGTDSDIEAFFACLGGDCCATCGVADFDGDGDAGTDADIEAFFRVLGGGTC